jgi:predicted small metal-binding protein
MEQREITKIQYYLYCPICDKEIKGNSTQQVNYNIKRHLQDKHKEEEE